METLKHKTRDGNVHAASDTEIINEVEHLLHLYQHAIDGRIWTNYDGIFDGVEDIDCVCYTVGCGTKVTASFCVLANPAGIFAGFS